jgi:hypothetical protein
MFNNLFTPTTDAWVDTQPDTDDVATAGDPSVDTQPDTDDVAKAGDPAVDTQPDTDDVATAGDPAVDTQPATNDVITPRDPDADADVVMPPTDPYTLVGPYVDMALDAAGDVDDNKPTPIYQDTPPT